MAGTPPEKDAKAGEEGTEPAVEEVEEEGW